MIESGNGKALKVAKAMAYQIAKEIGAMAVVLEGKVDAIAFTGESQLEEACRRDLLEVFFIAPIHMFLERTRWRRLQ